MIGRAKKTSYREIIFLQKNTKKQFFVNKKDRGLGSVVMRFGAAGCCLEGVSHTTATASHRGEEEGTLRPMVGLAS